MQPWEQAMLLIKTFWALEMISANQRREGPLMQKKQRQALLPQSLIPTGLESCALGQPEGKAPCTVASSSLHPSTECTISVLIQGYNAQS